MCIFIIDVKISGFNQIFLDQIKKSTNAKADEKINWKRVIEQMPNGFILINLKKRKIVFLNDSAMKIFDINDPLKKKESFDVINEKLGVLTLQKIQKEPIKSSKEIRNTNNSIKEKGCLLNFMDYFASTSNDFNEEEDPFYFETEVDFRKISLKIDFNIRYKGEKCFSIYLEDCSIQEKERISKLNIDFQNRIIKSFSHELKTPLNCAVPSLEMALYSLRPERPEEKMIQESLQFSLKSLKILSWVLNSILDLGSIISNQFFLNLEKIKIVEFVHDMISILEPQALRRNLRIIFKKEPLADDFMYSDKQRLSIILYNLLSNAIKFTFSGEITISILKLRTENRFKFYIMDTGIGIKLETVEKMNLYFSQKPTSTIDFAYFNDSNICFGLNVSNKIAHKLNEENSSRTNGLLIESSKEDEGTIFSFEVFNRESFSASNRNDKVISHKKLYPKRNTLNKKYDSLSYESLSIDSIGHDDIYSKLNQLSFENHNPFKGFIFNKNNKSLEERFLTKCLDCPSILVVDDDPFNQLTIEFILKKFKIKSEKANNGLEAVKILTKKKTDNQCIHNCFGIKLIFMDYEMPIMNGLESTSQIKKLITENFLPSLKIIGCTAFGTKTEIEKFYDAGIDDLVLKPITIQKIKDQLFKWNLIQE